MNEINQTKFRLDEIKKIETYFYEEINQRNFCCKKLNKYVTGFDYIDKILIVLSATSGRVSIILFTKILGAPVGIASASFTLFFSLPTGIIKELLKTTRSKKKKYDKILLLAKSELKSIETLISRALIDMDISHEEFITILNEKDKYKKMKENVKNISEKLEEKNKRIVWIQEEQVCKLLNICIIIIIMMIIMMIFMIIDFFFFFFRI